MLGRSVAVAVKHGLVTKTFHRYKSMPKELAQDWKENNLALNELE
jgi:hypothetical protein